MTTLTLINVMNCRQTTERADEYINFDYQINIIRLLNL